MKCDFLILLLLLVPPVFLNLVKGAERIDEFLYHQENDSSKVDNKNRDGDDGNGCNSENGNKPDNDKGTSANSNIYNGNGDLDHSNRGMRNDSNNAPSKNINDYKRNNDTGADNNSGKDSAVSSSLAIRNFTDTFPFLAELQNNDSKFIGIYERFRQDPILIHSVVDYIYNIDNKSQELIFTILRNVYRKVPNAVTLSAASLAPNNITLQGEYQRFINNLSSNAKTSLRLSLISLTPEQREQVVTSLIKEKEVVMGWALEIDLSPKILIKEVLMAHQKNVVIKKLNLNLELVFPGDKGLQSLAEEFLRRLTTNSKNLAMFTLHTQSPEEQAKIFLYLLKSDSGWKGQPPTDIDLDLLTFVEVARVVKLGKHIPYDDQNVRMFPEEPDKEMMVNVLLDNLTPNSIILIRLYFGDLTLEEQGRSLLYLYQIFKDKLNPGVKITIRDDILRKVITINRKYMQTQELEKIPFKIKYLSIDFPEIQVTIEDFWRGLTGADKMGLLDYLTQLPPEEQRKFVLKLIELNEERMKTTGAKIILDFHIVNNLVEEAKNRLRGFLSSPFRAVGFNDSFFHERTTRRRDIVHLMLHKILEYVLSWSKTSLRMIPHVNNLILDKLLLTVSSLITLVMRLLHELSTIMLNLFLVVQGHTNTTLRAPGVSKPLLRGHIKSTLTVPGLSKPLLQKKISENVVHLMLNKILEFVLYLLNMSYQVVLAYYTLPLRILGLGNPFVNKRSSGNVAMNIKILDYVLSALETSSKSVLNTVNYVLSVLRTPSKSMLKIFDYFSSVLKTLFEMMLNAISPLEKFLLPVSASVTFVKGIWYAFTTLFSSVQVILRNGVGALLVMLKVTASYLLHLLEILITYVRDIVAKV